MKRRIALCIAVSLCAGMYAGNPLGIYKKGWIDFNKNGVMDVYEDPSAPLEARVKDLLSQMTMEEKTCQMATLYGSGRVLKDSLPTEQWKNEIWKDGIANIDEQANGLGKFGSSLSYPYVNSVENRQAIQRWFVEQTRLGIPVDFTNEGIRGLCHDRSAGADSEGSGSAPDDLEQKAASGFGTDCGKTGDTGRTGFLCQRNGRISDARRVWKETVWKTV